jgi:16S rRNA uridine-516 pseudouridylate synthase and related pseudouridylate synthases
VKRMFAVCGLHVLYLKRIQMGRLLLDETLKPGEYRELTDEEYKLLTQSTKR